MRLSPLGSREIACGEARGLPVKPGPRPTSLPSTLPFWDRLGPDPCTILNTDPALQPLVVTFQWWPVVSEALRHPVASLTLDLRTQPCPVAWHSLHIQPVLCLDSIGPSASPPYPLHPFTQPSSPPGTFHGPQLCLVHL